MTKGNILFNVPLEDNSFKVQLTNYLESIYEEKGLFDTYRNGSAKLITERYVYYNNLDYDEKTKNREVLVSTLISRKEEGNDDDYINKPFLKEALPLQESVEIIILQAKTLLYNNFFNGYEESYSEEQFLATPYLKIMESEELNTHYIVVYYLYDELE